MRQPNATCDYCRKWGVVIWSMAPTIRKLCEPCHEDWFSRPGAA